MPVVTDFREEHTTLETVPVSVMTYRIGDVWYCHVSNADPGATIARAKGATSDEARSKAVARAGRALQA